MIRNLNLGAMDELTRNILFTAACVILPVLWGVLVNWVFDLWQSRNAEESQDEPIFPDYQI